MSVFVCDVGWVYAIVTLLEVVIFVLWVDRKGFVIDVKWKIKYVTNINLLGSLIGSQSLKNIDINVYFDGPLDNPEGIDEFPFKGEGIECYYMMLRRKLKTLTDLKRKIMDELKLNPTWYDIKIIYRYPQEVLHERIN